MKRSALTAVAIVALIGFPAFADEVRVVRDLDYVATADYADNKDRLDLYIPADAKRAPVILSLYGGGLTQGDKSRQTFVGQRFASAGFVTAVANYRLSPSVSHPAHVQDAAAAFAWIKTNIASHGGDPSNIFVIGHSAGAYLAGLLVLDPRYLAAHQLSPRDVKGVVPVAGFYYVDRPGVAPDRPKHIWGAEVSDWIDASPAKYIRADVPPLLLVYADGDDAWRRQQNEEFATALKKAGHRDVATLQINGRDHGSVWSKMQEGEEETSAAIIRFAHRLLKAGTSE